MKLLRISLVLFTIALFSLSCENEKIVTVDDLPEVAATYLKTSQPDAKVMFVKKERDFLSTKYKVQLDNRMEIEFNADGEVLDMDMDD